MSYEIAASLISNRVLQESYLDTIAQNLAVLGVHNHSGSLGEGSNQLSFSSCNVSGSLTYRYEYKKPIVGGAGYSSTDLTPFGGWVDAATTPGQFGSGSEVFVSQSTCPIPGLVDSIGFGYQSLSTFTTCPNVGMRWNLYIQPGTYSFKLYYWKTPCGGTIRLTDQSSVIWNETNTYNATYASAMITSSFYNSGSVPYKLELKTGASRSASAGGFNTLTFGSYMVEWTGS